MVSVFSRSQINVSVHSFYNVIDFLVFFYQINKDKRQKIENEKKFSFIALVVLITRKAIVRFSTVTVLLDKELHAIHEVSNFFQEKASGVLFVILFNLVIFCTYV